MWGICILVLHLFTKHLAHLWMSLFLLAVYADQPSQKLKNKTLIQTDTIVYWLRKTVKQSKRINFLWFIVEDTYADKHETENYCLKMFTVNFIIYSLSFNIPTSPHHGTSPSSGLFFSLSTTYYTRSPEQEQKLPLGTWSLAISPFNTLQYWHCQISLVFCIFYCR